MTPEQLQRCLDSFEEAKLLLRSWNLRDCDRGQRNLQHLVQALGMERVSELCRQLGQFLPRCADPDMALNNFERFLADAAGKDAEQLPTLLDGRARTLETLVQLFSTSQFFSDLLIAFPEYLDTLRIPLRSSPSRAEMLKQLQDDVDAAREDSAVLRAFRRFRQRQLLRIGTNDIIRDRSLEEVTRDISRVADTALEVALSTALRNLGQRFGEPHGRRRRAGPVRHSRLRQARRQGTQLFQRHRSDVPLRPGRLDRRQTQQRHRQRRVLRPRCQRGRPAAVDAHRSRPGLSGRSAAAARRTARSAGPLPGQHAALLRHPGPDLGTAGPHQDPSRGRRRPARRGVSQGHRAVRLSQISQLSPRSTRSRPSNAASSTAPTGPAKATATSRPGTAASATSSSPSSSCSS